MARDPLFRLGVMSDLHGYISGVESALTLFADHGVNQILCAGDLIDGAEAGVAVTERIQALGIPCVQGNHDSQAWSSVEPATPHAAGLASRFQEPNGLRAKHVEYLSQLPLNYQATYSGLRVCLTHATMWSQFEYLFPHSPRDLFLRMASFANADVICYGHTHMPLCRQVGTTWFVNPGSIYGNRHTFNRSCAIIDCQPFAVRIYDLDTKQIMMSNIAGES